MLERILERFGIMQSTLLLSACCMLASVLIAASSWILLGQTNTNELLLVAMICPAVIAPPIIYSYSRLSKKLGQKRQDLQQANEELKSALSEVKELSGLLPICASCKKIRDDKGYWNKIETYIRDRSKADFTHSICPDCAKKIYPDLL